MTNLNFIMTTDSKGKRTFKFPYNPNNKEIKELIKCSSTNPNGFSAERMCNENFHEGMEMVMRLLGYPRIMLKKKSEWGNRFHGYSMYVKAIAKNWSDVQKMVFHSGNNDWDNNSRKRMLASNKEYTEKQLRNVFDEVLEWVIRDIRKNTNKDCEGIYTPAIRNYVNHLFKGLKCLKNVQLKNRRIVSVYKTTSDNDFDSANGVKRTRFISSIDFLIRSSSTIAIMPEGEDIMVRLDIPFKIIKAGRDTGIILDSERLNKIGVAIKQMPTNLNVSQNMERLSIEEMKERIAEIEKANQIKLLIREIERDLEKEVIEKIESAISKGYERMNVMGGYCSTSVLKAGVEQQVITEDGNEVDIVNQAVTELQLEVEQGKRSFVSEDAKWSRVLDILNDDNREFKFKANTELLYTFIQNNNQNKIEKDKKEYNPLNEDTLKTLGITRKFGRYSNEYIFGSMQGVEVGSISEFLRIMESDEERKKAQKLATTYKFKMALFNDWNNGLLSNEEIEEWNKKGETLDKPSSYKYSDGIIFDKLKGVNGNSLQHIKDNGMAWLVR